MPEKAGTWRKIARGIWRSTTTGRWRVFDYRTLPAKSAKLPADKTLKEVRVWLADWQSDRRRDLDPQPDANTTPNTFAHDVEVTYLPGCAAMADYKERTRHMRLWVEEFGDSPRRAITPAKIRGVLTRWRTTGPKMKMMRKTATAQAHYVPVEEALSASQVVKRHRALRNFFTIMNGRRGDNPAAEIPEFDEGDRPPRALPWPVIQAILAAMPDYGRGDVKADGSKTRARLVVMSATGLSHAQLARLTRSDVDLRLRTMFIGRRKKGAVKELKGRTVPLLPQAVEAFKAFDALECWGAFSRSSMWKSFQLAVSKATIEGKPLHLTGIRPYDFRHSYATQMVAAVGNLDLAQELLVHASKETTKHYARAAVNPLVAAAFARFTQQMQRVTATRGPAPTRQARGTRKPSAKPTATRQAAKKSKTYKRTRTPF
jgi:integrase